MFCAGSAAVGLGLLIVHSLLGLLQSFQEKNIKSVSEQEWVICGFRVPRTRGPFSPGPAEVPTIEFGEFILSCSFWEALCSLWVYLI